MLISSETGDDVEGNKNGEVDIVINESEEKLQFLRSQCWEESSMTKTNF